MKKSVTCIIVLCFMVIPALSWGASVRPGPYVSGFIGATVTRNTEVSSSQFSNGGLVPFNDQVEFDPGLNIGGTGGYDFGYMRLEGEMSYKYAEMSNITTAEGVRFGNPDGGSIGVFAMMANAFVDLHNSGPITPYFGGGVGFANLYLSGDFGDVTANGTFFYPEDDDTVFAYQAGAGLGIALNRRLTLDIGYRYFGTARATFSNGFDSASLKYESHNAAVGVRVKF